MRICKRYLRQKKQRDHNKRANDVTPPDAIEQPSINHQEKNGHGDAWKAIREWLMIVLVAATVFLTWTTYRVFHQTMLDARVASYSAHLDNLRAEEVAAKTSGEATSAAMAARNSADAAQGQLAEMRHSQRAVVSVLHSEPLAGGLSDNPTWLVQIGVQNTGNTPTQNLTIYSDTGMTTINNRFKVGRAVGFFPPFEPADFDARLKRVTPQRFPLGPHVVASVASNRVTEGQLQSSMTDGAPLPIVYGRITYDDNLPKYPPHVVRFCFMFGIGNIPTMKIERGKVISGKVEPAIYLCPFWNCADNECKGDERRYKQTQAQWRRDRATTFPRKPTHK